MGHSGLRRVATTGLVLALSACGGRALLEDGAAGAAAGGQSGALGSGGAHAAGGTSVTLPQGGASVITSGGSSSSMLVCMELCEAVPCPMGKLVTPLDQCCPICVTTTPASDAGPPLADAGSAPPPSQCPGLTANPPAECPLTQEDVACSSSEDCTIGSVLSSADSCVRLVFGMNRTSVSANTGTCNAPPVAQGGECMNLQIQTQDCQVTQDEEVFAVCTYGKCMSYGPPPVSPP